MKWQAAANEYAQMDEVVYQRAIARLNRRIDHLYLSLIAVGLGSIMQLVTSLFR